LIVNRNGSLSRGIEKELFANKDIHSYMLVPLLMDGIVSGMLALAARNKGNFSGSPGQMDLIASGLSLLIERNRLSSAVVKQKKALDAARQIGLAMVSSNFDLEKVLNFSMDRIRKILGVEAGSLFLKEKDRLKVAIAFNTKVDVVKKFRLKIGQGIAGHVAAGGESMIVNDTGKSSQFFPDIDKHTGFKTRSVLCVPLVAQKKLIGVIEVLNKVNGDFGAEDEAILSSLAGSISVALLNARLHQQAALQAHHEHGVPLSIK
jgi:GAF domain-containing protein